MGATPKSHDHGSQKPDRRGQAAGGPTVSSGIAGKLIDYAVSKGANASRLVEKAGIDLADLEDLDHRIPFAHYVTLMRAAKQETGDPAFALHFGEAVDLSEFSVVGLLFHQCETLAEALIQINRYGQLVTEVDSGDGPRAPFARRDGQLWLLDARRNPNAFPELTEATFARFVSMARRFGGEPIVKELHVTHEAPPYRAEYERICRGPVLFGCAWNAMRIEERKLTARFPVKSKFLFGILAEHADALLKRLVSPKLMRQRVEAFIIPILHTGTLEMASVAAHLGISRKTLFRRLKEEGTTYAVVLDELRHSLAAHYLSGGKVSVSETAYLVGFADPAAFSRAFKRWTGSSPRAFRAPANRLASGGQAPDEG